MKNLRSRGGAVGVLALVTSLAALASPAPSSVVHAAGMRPQSNDKGTGLSPMSRRPWVTTPSPRPPGADYPLKVSANRRYLVDQQDVPFLMMGDSPQALIANVSEVEADAYFADREANDFNAV